MTLKEAYSFIETHKLKCISPLQALKLNLL